MTEENKNESKSLDEIIDEEKTKPENTPPPETDEDDEEDKKWPGVSCILPDGSLVEMLYDAKKRTTKLAIYKDGEVAIEDSIRIDDSTVFTPMAANQDILRNNFVLFPSAVGSYQSNEVLYHEVRAFIDKYVKLTDKFLSVVAAYVMMTWVYDQFQTVGYLRAVGLHGTGKSRLLSVAGNLCYKANLSGGAATLAALFRTLDLFNPTLVFDEADLGEKESGEMRQVLRQGYSKGSPVSRMDPKPNGKMYVKTFNVFGPKIIASQSDFRDPALESRCLTEHMYPTEDSERPIELSKAFHEEALLLRNKLLMFRFRNHELVTSDEAVLKDIRLPRLRQTGLAVVSVAKMLGVQALEDIVEFLKEYEIVLENQQTDTVEHDVLLCLLDLMKQSHIKASEKVRIGTDLTERFNEKQYEEYSDKKPYSSGSQYNTYSVMKTSNYKVSSKKIGGFVRKMGIRVERDRDGFFIPVFKEYPRIRALAKRYRLDALYELPENSPNGVKRILSEDEKISNAKLKEERKRKREAEEKRKKDAEERMRNPKPMSDEEYEEIFGSPRMETNTQSIGEISVVPVTRKTDEDVSSGG